MTVYDAQYVIDHWTDMDMWEDRIWVNHKWKLFFVPIWRNANTSFMYQAKEWGYSLQKYDTSTMTDYRGFTFIRHPKNRFNGQMERAVKNNKDTSVDYWIDTLRPNSFNETDMHFTRQEHFLFNHDIEWYIDLDNLKWIHGDPHDDVVNHINSIISHYGSSIAENISVKKYADLSPEDIRVVQKYYYNDIELYHRAIGNHKFDVGIVGTGNIGSALETILQNNGIRTCSYDTHKISDTYSMVAEADTIWICVDTPTKNWGNSLEDVPSDYDYTNLRSALDLFAVPDKTIIIGCTVSPGTIRKLSKEYPNCNLYYCPFLISQGNVLDGLRQPDCWFLGHNPGNSMQLNQLKEKIKRFSPSPIYSGTWEEAELAKVMYNSWIIQKINFANWVSDITDRLAPNTNADRIMTWLKKCDNLITSPAYMTPGWGDGGPCHPRDNLMMSWLTQQLELPYDPAMHNHNVRLQQATLLAQKAVNTGLPVIILGKSYKPGVDSTAGSYGLIVAQLIQQLGGEVYFEDHDVPGDYCYILAHADWYGHTPSEQSRTITIWKNNLEKH